jgi:hypothetical protein
MILESIILLALAEMLNLISPMLENGAKLLLIENAPLMSIYPFWEFILFNVCVPILCIAGTIIALMFVLSNDEQSRAESKKRLQDFIKIVIIISVSFILYLTLSEVFTFIAKEIWNFGGDQYIFYHTENILEWLFFGAFYSVALLLADLTLVIRYILVTSGSLFVLIALMIYPIPHLKRWSYGIITILITANILSVIDIIILKIGGLVYTSLGQQMNLGIISIATWLLVAIVNYTLITYSFSSIHSNNFIKNYLTRC